jgi:hypothetical protein
MELQHFSDDHPLIFNEVLNGPFECNGCGEPMEGSCYSCKKCDFNLHPSCAELPHELQHPIHWKHPLILHKTPPYDGGTCTCNGCNLPCKKFIYHCPLCKFDLDIKCASLPLTIETEIHDHTLTLLRNSISFTCNVCGKEGKGMPYLCAVCGFWVHLKCASLPRIVKHIRHKHPLNFTYSTNVDNSEHKLCQLCVKMVDTNQGVYFCSICDYVAHLDCATNEECEDEKEPLESTVTVTYEDSELDELAQNTKVGEEKIEMMPIEIKHFSHEHDLKLFEELENYEICDGCIRPIFPPFYNCAQCDFFLHKSCVELPLKKRHPLHQHQLTLQLRRPMASQCDACKCLSNGFIYNCQQCHFELDISCSLISDTLTHVAHKDRLMLSSITKAEKCSACNSSSKIFRCPKCEFTLDFGCATLPRTVKYRQHEHLFTLRYTVEDDSGEYYCDICEEERNPKHWFYYCEKCSYPAHPKCIFGDFRNIKFGIYTSDVHQHPLTLVRKTKDQSPCDKCGYPCNVLAYECATCNINIHLECLLK